MHGHKILMHIASEFPDEFENLYRFAILKYLIKGFNIHLGQVLITQDNRESGCSKV